MLINTSAKDQINSLAPAPASLGVCLRGWWKPPPFNEGLFSLETAIHRDNESHPGALRELGVKVFTWEYIWFLLCCYHFCAMRFVSFGSVWVFGSSLSFSPNYSYGEYNVFAIIEAYWQSNEVLELCRHCLVSCLIYGSRGLRLCDSWGPFLIWEPGFEAYSGHHSVYLNFLSVGWILVQGIYTHLMDREAKEELSCFKDRVIIWIWEWTQVYY